MSSTPSRPPRAPSPPPGSWEPARRAAKLLSSPIQSFLTIEAASGVLLMIAAAVALVWANSPWHHSYEELWHTPIGFQVGQWEFSRSLHFWINDGLMAIFFLVVGLEIRREIFEGELQSLRQSAMPLAGAIGGMLVPAGIYMLLNHGRVGAHGWAIPMATDIAFAVGVLTLLGPRVPGVLRVLLLALAVIDDIGAILVIALFYTGGLAMYGAWVCLGGLAMVFALRWSGVRGARSYVVPGAVVWAGLFMAGLHPTLAGVMLGLITPVMPWFGPSGFAAATKEHLEAFEEIGRHELLTRLDKIDAVRREAVSPVERLIHFLHPWVAFGIMPLFALANAGVPLAGATLVGDELNIFLGIVLGLVVGKPIGVVGMVLLTRGRENPEGSSIQGVSRLSLVGLVAGIGFTMSLFIAQLAFDDPHLLDTAKLGVLVGSAIAMVISLGYGAWMLREETAEEE